MLQLADVGAHVGHLLPEGNVGPTGFWMTLVKPCARDAENLQ